VHTDFETRITHSIPDTSRWRALFFGCSRVLNVPKGTPPVIDPLSRAGRELKAAEEFFELANNPSSPFMRAYYRRVAERYLSSQGGIRTIGPSTSLTGRSSGG
jgi:hypothetical protein